MLVEDVAAALVDTVGADTWPLLDLLDRLEDRFDLGLVEDILEGDPAFVIVEEHGEADDGPTIEKIFHLPSRAEGLRLGFVLDRSTEAGDHIDLHPWLAPVASWLIGGQPSVLVGDEPIDTWTEERVVHDELADVLVGPDGWLDDLADRWVTATVTDGRLRLDAAPGPLTPDPEGADRGLIDAIATGFQRTARTVTVEAVLADGPIDLRLAGVDAPFQAALAADRSAIVDRPLPPLPDLYRAAGLDIEGHDVAEAGVDWDLLRAWRQRRRTMLSHGLDGDDADALTLVVGAALSVMAEGAEALGADEDERDGAAILMAGLLERPPVAAAVWNELERRGRTEELEPFLSELDHRLDGVEIVGPGWLRARVLEGDGRSAEAAQLLGAVVGPGCRHTPALLDLAGYAADRSELAVAADLIRRSGAESDRAAHHLDDHHDRLLDEIAGYRRVEASAQIGRNQPCPCGSGRKFKACHLRSGYVTFEDRAGWLNDKMVRYALRHGATVRAEMAGALAGGDPLFAIDLEVSPLTIELALWEGKLIDGFAASRRALLPADEAALIDGWTSARRSIMRVAGIDGKRLTFDDLIRGGPRVVDNIELRGGPLQPGTIVLARPVPVGEVNRLLSPVVPLDADAADALTPAVASGDPLELATALERVLSPQRGRVGR